jgi:predicted amidophosphoribosyltransferase
VIERCPNCAYDVSPLDRRCDHCGRDLNDDRECHWCGHGVRLVNGRCADCGAQLRVNVLSKLTSETETLDDQWEWAASINTYDHKGPGLKRELRDRASDHTRVTPSVVRRDREDLPTFEGRLERLKRVHDARRGIMPFVG